MKCFVAVVWFACLIYGINQLPLTTTNQRRNPSNYGTQQNPATSCHSIHQHNPTQESGFFYVKVDSIPIQTYCHFKTNQPVLSNGYYDAKANGRSAEVVNIALPTTDDGDPEGAMGMQYDPDDLPPGVFPHFTQDIINEMEKLYWNKTSTIANLIDKNNERERNQTQINQLKQPFRPIGKIFKIAKLFKRRIS